jgi:bifunctional DNA-binding transcriptional regulator/antitoxin component of YhaV-PrlF toxin-antitoxin module
MPAEPGSLPEAQATIWGKRRITLPKAISQAAGLDVGDRLQIRADGIGRIVMEKSEQDPAERTVKHLDVVA